MKQIRFHKMGWQFAESRTRQLLFYSPLKSDTMGGRGWCSSKISVFRQEGPWFDHDLNI